MDRYTPYRIYYWFGDRYRDVKHGFQRMFRGYDDTAYWGLNFYIAEIALPVLKSYKKNKCGIPHIDGFDTGKDDALNFDAMKKEWYIRLGKMIKSFEYVIKDEFFPMKNGKADNVKFEKIQKELNEGLHLFAEHFQGLWD